MSFLGFISGSARLAYQGFRSPERKRLESDIDLWRKRLDHSKEKLEQASKLFDAAAAEATTGDMDNGWKFLHEAQRLMIAASSDAVRQAAHVALREESQAKLPAWRKDAVAKLLELKTAESLAKALELAHEHSDNVYMRNRLLRRQISVVFVILIVAIGLLLWTMHVWSDVTTVKETGLTLHAAVRALILGALGSCLSALLTFSSAKAELSIPERLANVYITFSRPLIGATSGLVGLFLMTSGVVDLKVFTGWAVPFVFGFSERLLLGVLQPQPTK